LFYLAAIKVIVIIINSNCIIAVNTFTNSKNNSSNNYKK